MEDGGRKKLAWQTISLEEDIPFKEWMYIIMDVNGYGRVTWSAAGHPGLSLHLLLVSYACHYLRF